MPGVPGDIRRFIESEGIVIDRDPTRLKAPKPIKPPDRAKPRRSPDQAAEVPS